MRQADSMALQACADLAHMPILPLPGTPAAAQVWDLSAQVGELKDEVAPVAGAQGKVHKVNARQVHTHSSGTPVGRAVGVALLRR